MTGRLSLPPGGTMEADGPQGVWTRRPDIQTPLVAGTPPLSPRALPEPRAPHPVSPDTLRLRAQLPVVPCPTPPTALGRNLLYPQPRCPCPVCRLTCQTSPALYELPRAWEAVRLGLAHPSQSQSSAGPPARPPLCTRSPGGTARGGPASAWSWPSSNGSHTGCFRQQPDAMTPSLAALPAGTGLPRGAWPLLRHQAAVWAHPRPAPVPAHLPATPLTTAPGRSAGPEPHATLPEAGARRPA